MRVANKRMILTGAGSGIGRELAKLLISKGAHVIALDINEENLNTLQSEVNNTNISVNKVDVSSKEHIEAFKDEYLKMYESVDILINNAGIIQPFKTINDLDMEIINWVMNINFYGPVILTKIFLPLLLERPEAHIVNVSSMGGFFPFPKQSIYGASKAALKLFTEGLYAELLNTKVHVTSVLPGAVNTAITKNSNIETKDSGNYKMLSAVKAAEIIIDAIEKDKFQVFVGTDSKMMNIMYKLNAKKAISFINKKMGDIAK